MLWYSRVYDRFEYCSFLGDSLPLGHNDLVVYFHAVYSLGTLLRPAVSQWLQYLCVQSGELPGQDICLR